MNHPTQQQLTGTLNALHARAQAHRAPFTMHIGRRVDVHPEGFQLFDHDGARLTHRPVSAKVAAGLLANL